MANPRVERIKAEISLDRVLSDYGYDVRAGGGEQQFRCDLHGDGNDNAPSARVYPTTGTWYCFACGRARDAVATVMEKEGLEFPLACRALEVKYGLSPWTWDSKEKSDPYEEKDSEGGEDLEKRVLQQLTRATRGREIPYDEALKLWEGYDLVASRETKTESLWRKLYDKLPK